MNSKKKKNFTFWLRIQIDLFHIQRMDIFIITISLPHDVVFHGDQYLRQQKRKLKKKEVYFFYYLQLFQYTVICKLYAYSNVIKSFELNRCTVTFSPCVSALYLNDEHDEQNDEDNNNKTTKNKGQRIKDVFRTVSCRNRTLFQIY